MDFTPYIWSLYTASPRGQEALRKPPEDFIPHGYFKNADADVLLCDSTGEVTGLQARVNINEAVQEWCAGKTVTSAEEARELFQIIVEDNIKWSTHHDDEDIAGNLIEDNLAFNIIEPLSFGLYKVFPYFFVPLLFRVNFDKFQKICDSFKIPIPLPPLRSQKRERSLYYLDLNDALQEFRRMHGLSPSELFVFLSDFAPRVIQAEEDLEITLPSSVWIAMANALDFEFLDKTDVSTVTAWGGNVDARRGDIVLMYSTAPRSHISSIWRVMGDGYADPFYYYYGAFRDRSLC